MSVRNPATRTNLCTNPRGAVGTTGWTNSNYNTFEATGSLPTLVGLPEGITTGFHCVGDSSNDRAVASYPVVSGAGMAVAIYAHIVSATATGGRLLIKDSGGSTESQTNFTTVGGGFARVGAAVPSDETDTWTVEVRQLGSGNLELYYTAVLIEQAPEVRDYFDGGFGWGKTAWAGTAHASTSTVTRVLGI